MEKGYTIAQTCHSSLIYYTIFMIKELLLVGTGSFIGGAARYAISLMMRQTTHGFPWATFAVNIAGCLLIGLIWGAASRHNTLPPNVVLFLTTGLCGGFTTFSTFSKECISLLQTGSYMTFTLYVIGSVVLGILAVAAGYAVGK